MDVRYAGEPESARPMQTEGTTTDRRCERGKRGGGNERCRSPMGALTPNPLRWWWDQARGASSFPRPLGSCRRRRRLHRWRAVRWRKSDYAAPILYRGLCLATTAAHASPSLSLLRCSPSRRRLLLLRHLFFFFFFRFTVLFTFSFFGFPSALVSTRMSRPLPTGRVRQ